MRTPKAVNIDDARISRNSTWSSVEILEHLSSAASGGLSEEDVQTIVNADPNTPRWSVVAGAGEHQLVTNTNYLFTHTGGDISCRLPDVGDAEIGDNIIVSFFDSGRVYPNDGQSLRFSHNQIATNADMYIGTNNAYYTLMMVYAGGDLWYCWGAKTNFSNIEAV